MGLHILLADPREYHRRGLRTLFSALPIVDCIYEVATVRELKNYLVSHAVDLVVIHQSLISDSSVLPRDHFVIMAEELDKDLLRIAREQGARGYLLENPSLEFLRVVLRIAEREGGKGFFLDPAITLELLDYISRDGPTSVDLSKLTPAERKVLYLMHDGLNYSEIAEQLSVTTGTVRSHVHNMSGKLGISRQQMMRLTLPENKRDRKG